MSFLITTDGMNGPVGYVSTENVAAATGLPVDKSTTTWRTIFRVVTPAAAGDVLRVHGEASVTNDVGVDRVTRKATGVRYTIGVGFHLWFYDVDDTSDVPISSRMIRFGSSEGENVTVAGHHLPLDITRWLTVPATWPAGHRITVALCADAHSTAWKTNGGGDVLTVDNLGMIEALRWTAA